MAEKMSLLSVQGLSSDYFTLSYKGIWMSAEVRILLWNLSLDYELSFFSVFFHRILTIANVVGLF